MKKITQNQINDNVARELIRLSNSVENLNIATKRIQDTDIPAEGSILRGKPFNPGEHAKSQLLYEIQEQVVLHDNISESTMNKLFAKYFRLIA